MANHITDTEFDTHVFPTAEENFASDRNGGQLRAWTDAEYAEITEWANILREGYEDGSFDITWR